MSLLGDLGRAAWRFFVTDGVPSSGVQQPDKVDLDKVKASLPYGIVTVKAVKGGLDIPDPENNDPAVIASAAVCVSLDLP